VISSDCKELREGTAQAPCRLRLIRKADRAHEEAFGKAWQQLLGRFPAGPVSIEHERQPFDAGLNKKCLLLGEERTSHKRDGCCAESVQTKYRPISLDHDQMLGAGDNGAD
jgi:hypothetical protein